MVWIHAVVFHVSFTDEFIGEEDAKVSLLFRTLGRAYEKLGCGVKPLWPDALLPAPDAAVYDFSHWCLLSKNCSYLTAYSAFALWVFRGFWFVTFNVNPF
jgi:hypothetical protein